jgi:hypothetical protein
MIPKNPYLMGLYHPKSELTWGLEIIALRWVGNLLSVIFFWIKMPISMLKLATLI